MSKRPQKQLDFSAYFFRQQASAATFFTPAGVFGGKKKSNQREAILAMVLEKHLKAWLNINVYLRHIGYAGLEFIPKTECDFLQKVLSQHRNLHQ